MDVYVITDVRTQEPRRAFLDWDTLVSQMIDEGAYAGDGGPVVPGVPLGLIGPPAAGQARYYAARASAWAYVRVVCLTVEGDWAAPRPPSQDMGATRGGLHDAVEFLRLGGRPEEFRARAVRLLAAAPAELLEDICSLVGYPHT